MTNTLTMTVNGASVTRDVPANTLLVHFLRDSLRLTGTHVGCDTTQCGACTVHLDGSAVKSCTTLAMTCEGSDVTTIEGLASGDTLHPMQEAFRANHGLQCGFCTPGFVMSAIKIVERLGSGFDDTALREELEGFLTDNGVFRDMVFYIDLLCAHIYAGYINDRGGQYLRADFCGDRVDGMLHTRRMLGLDAVDTESGRTRLKLIDGQAWVLSGMGRLTN